MGESVARYTRRHVKQKETETTEITYLWADEVFHMQSNVEVNAALFPLSFYM